jgi:hypothetical protein
VWRTAVFAGQRVIHRWLGCGQPGCKPGSASTVAESHPVVHRCPPVVHRISTGFVPKPGDNAETLPARRPQNLQQEIHTPPQGVGKKVTVRTCPHRFAQELSTSVVDGEISCPPLGITSWGRGVDNLGTRRCPRGGCGCARWSSTCDRPCACSGVSALGRTGDRPSRRPSRSEAAPLRRGRPFSPGARPSSRGAFFAGGGPSRPELAFLRGGPFSWADGGVWPGPAMARA